MGDYAYYNGTISRYSDAKVPLSDRLIYFGDGVYDVMIGHNKKIFLAEEHFNRLFSNAKELEIPIDFSKSYINYVINRLIGLCGYDQYIIYISISRNAKNRIHSYLGLNGTNLLITIKQFEHSDKTYLDLITEEDKRYYFCNIKTTNLLPAVLASSKAEKLNCDEAVFIRGNIVTECAHSNIFIIKNNTIITHPLSNLILPGITRQLVITLAESLNIKVKEMAFEKDALFDADEVIVSSTTKFIKRVASIDGIPTKRKNPKIFLNLENAVKNQYYNI